MFSFPALLLSFLPLSYAAETVFGVFIFHRHGDRTAKSTPPANLTNLGYSEVLSSGTYYRNRYISSNAPLRLNGVSSDIVKQSQISASAPADVVLANSCAAFLQGFFPPVGSTIGPQTLRDGTVVESPLNGFQLIPIGSVSTGANSEGINWLQDSTNCANAKTSSNEYFYSPEYQQLLNTTQDFYNGIYPVINRTFNSTMTSYKNAYTIFDLINVAEIHNATIQSPSLITPTALTYLRTLADAHEYNLAWNVSSPIRAIAGMTLAGQIVDFFNTTINTNGASKINVQFGNYATFTSLFGLANLLQTNADFYGVPDYTSSMAFELFTNSSSSVKPFPPSDELNVRFLFHNGTASPSSEPSVYPLFGRNQQTVTWNDFTYEMAKFSVGDTKDWCKACGNSTGTCAQYADASSATGSGSGSGSSSGNGGISTAVGGVVGAMVTLAVVLGLEALVMLIGGLRLVSKKGMQRSADALDRGNRAKTAT